MFSAPIDLAITSGALSAFGTWLILPVLKRHVMDIPVERSNHKAPVPRGGGIAMIAAALIGMLLAELPASIAACAVLLAVISFMDDLRSMPVGIRLLAQIIAVEIALGAMPGHVLPEFVPPFAEKIFLALLWVWFINLTNFMDGIDGISAMQAIMVSAGICLVHFVKPWSVPYLLSAKAGVMAASAYGFYLFNRSPARVFMGDVGSIPLGFLTGYLLLSLAASGNALPALILPAYYVSDATYTLVKRQLRGQKVWQAHSEHAYQQAVRSGLTHAQVVMRISWLNAVLIALAMCASLSMMAGIVCLVAAYGLTFRLIRRFLHEAAAP